MAPMSYARRCAATFGLTLAICAGWSFAENIVFPANTPGVHDITKAPYNADNTGRTDVTAILNRALEETRCQSNWASQILYLPNGTYLVTGTVHWKFPPYTVGPHLHGQSRTGTVIRLKDSTFSSPTTLGFVIHTGSDVAQNFNRGLFNVTVYTGKGNPGAIGVFWYANNEALMSDINIVSGDGQGAAGLEIGTVEEGPCGVRRTYIKGFRFGVLARPSLNTTTLSEISLEGQTQYGVYHTGKLPLYIDSLYSRNTVTAVYNGAEAQLVLINADLGGGNSSVPAIINETGGMLFARNIKTQGYSTAIQSTSGPTPAPSGNNVGEFLSHQGTSLFGSPLVSLNLPIKRAPEIAWEQDMNKWANVESYRSGRTDAQAIQAAIDDAAKTSVIIPMGRTYNLSGAEVVLRGNIKLLIAAGSGFEGSGSIAVTDAGSPSIVKVMKLAGPQPGTSPYLVSRTSRTVVVESFLMGPQTYGIRHEGTGDMFVTDVVCPMQVSNAQAHVWAWHYDAEGGTYQLAVSAGTAWIFGWKDEGTGSSANLTGGTTEILGYLNYCAAADNVPEFVLSNATVSIVAARKGAYCPGYATIVRETKGGITRELLASANTIGYPTTFDVPLYTSYDPAAVPEPAPLVAAAPRPGLSVRMLSGPRILVSLDNDGPAEVRVLDAAGRVVERQNLATNRAGQCSGKISLLSAADGIYCIEVAAQGKRYSRNVVWCR